MGQNSSAHVAHIVGLQTDAVVVTETGFIDLESERNSTLSKGPFICTSNLKIHLEIRRADGRLLSQF